MPPSVTFRDFQTAALSLMGPELRLLCSASEWGVRKLPGAIQGFTAHKDTSHKLLLVAKIGSVSSDGKQSDMFLYIKSTNLIESVEGCLGRWVFFAQHKFGCVPPVIPGSYEGTWVWMRVWAVSCPVYPASCSKAAGRGSRLYYFSAQTQRSSLCSCSKMDIMQAVAATFHLFFFLNLYQSDLKGKSGRERMNERAALLIGSWTSKAIYQPRI